MSQGSPSPCLPPLSEGTLAKRADLDARVPPAASHAAAPDHADAGSRGLLLPPLSDKMSAAAALAAQQRRLEWEDRLEAVLKREGALRSTIMGLEYEERYRCVWRYHEEGEKKARIAESCKKKAIAWKQQKYLESVRSFQKWGSVWTEETNAREELLLAEQQDWEYLGGWWEVEALQMEQRRLQEEAALAEERWEATEAVRRFEVAVGLSALRKQKQFEPKEPLDFVSSTVVTGVPDERAVESRRAKVKYLMDYTVNEEEFRCRQAIRYEEALKRVEMASVFEKLTTVALNEQSARLELYEVFYWGANEHRLVRIISIQRWWRTLRSHPWSYYRRHHLQHECRALRVQHTSKDYRRELERLEKEKDRSGSPTLDDFQQRLQLERAALRRYPAMLDEYVFSLSQFFKDFIESEKHRLAAERDRCLRRRPDFDALTIVADESDAEWSRRRGMEKCLAELQRRSELPIRIFTRFPLPYAKWRAHRWLEFAQRTLAGAEALRGREASERAELECAESRNAVGLEAFHDVLNVGPEAVAALMTSLSCYVQSEREARHLIEERERECRANLNVEHCRLSDWIEAVQRPATLLMAEEAEQRRAIAREAAEGCNELDESHWRWNRLASARARIAARYRSRCVWNIALHGLAAVKFVSLKSAAAVLVRFYFRHRHKFESRRRGGSSPNTLTEAQELVVELRGAKLVKVLEGMFKERRRGLRRQQKERRKEIESNKKLNGSRGFFSCVRSRLPGFSFLLRPSAPDADGQAAEDKGEAPKAAVDMGEWMEWYNLWMDENADEPREEHYPAVLQRFQSEYREFYNSMAFLLSSMRNGRERIERDEQQYRGFLRNRDCYRKCACYQVMTQEAWKRRCLEAEEEDARYHFFNDLRQMKATLQWGLKAVDIAAKRPSSRRPCHLQLQRAPVRHVRVGEDSHVTAVKRRYLNIPYQALPSAPGDIHTYVHNGPTLPHILQGKLFPNSDAVAEADRATAAERQEREMTAIAMPALSPVDRFIARESVLRARIEADRKRELAGLLEGYAVPFRQQIERESFTSCLAECVRVDKRFPSHSPIAAVSFILLEEASARSRLEREAWRWYQLPLLRAHQHYLNDVLMMQFTFGHLTMSSHASYFDKRLLKLLTQRLRFVEAKLDDLVELETASRSRLEYMQEVTANMRFKWKKLVY